MGYKSIGKHWYEYVRGPALSTAVQNVLGYSTRNHKFKRVQPYSQNWGDEVGIEGDLGNCCRFATLRPFIMQDFFEVQQWTLFAPSVCDFIFELP